MGKGDNNLNGLSDASRRELEEALEEMHTGLALLRPDGTIVFTNPSFATVLGLDGTTLRPGGSLAEACDAVISPGGERREGDANATDATVGRLLGDLVRKAEGSQGHKREMPLGNGRHVELSIQGSPTGYIATVVDVSARRDATDVVTRNAYRDHLTGLANRAAYDRDIAAMMAELAGGGQPFAVLFCDLDKFKAVNDTLGHHAGDELLRQTAHRFKGATRDGDPIYRLGGDEFVVVLRKAGEREAGIVADRLITRMSEPFRIEDREVRSGTTIGIALAPHHGTDGVTVLNNADFALYSAKQTKRGSRALFDEGMASAKRDREDLKADLVGAIARDELTLHYQPIVTSDTGAVVCVEALIRWAHPTRGMVPPLRFIPLAEENGLINVIGEWALHRACRDVARWPEAVKVAVNLSATQFKDPDGLVVQVRAAIDAAGIEPERLELELTETVLVKDEDAVTRAIAAFREIGVGVSLDDFGSEYSSLAYVSRFDFRKIKLDRSFTRRITTNAKTAAVVRAMARLCMDLGAVCVVEGVETEAELALVRTLGVPQWQGYLNARPVPADDVAALITDRTGE